MLSSSLTSKGQITIPVELRDQLGLKPGDKVGFSLEDDHIVIFKKLHSVSAAFGICKPKKSASLQDIENAIKKEGGKK